MKRRRGIALADFVTGTIIFSAVVLGFMTLTRTKFRVLDAASLRTQALAAAEAEVDAIRLDGLRGEPKGTADRDGFRKVRAFEPLGKIPAARGTVEARALRMKEGAAYRMLEVRVRVDWRDTTGTSSLFLSTVVVP